MEDFPELFTKFESDACASGRLAWHPTCVEDGVPKRVQHAADGASGLLVEPHGKTDYWRKTYYEPLLLKSDGHILAVTVQSPPKLVAETHLTLNVKSQFDQAGLMVFVDDEHWLKTGLEYCDGKIYLGCVVTNGFSDWSTQDWPSNKLSIRVYALPNDSCVVEAGSGDDWKMIRIAHLAMGDQKVKLGVYTCSPTAAGASTVFHSLSIKATSGYDHKA
ncbi:uncharacterized protein LOC135818295 [Sycon ciliatum]|uniref:uncharacterized protein LOC135818295 n=1 Tax=Sycon ciliatum TaxID=27933 RepID=UPI0020AAF2A3|eukprot:scpid78992/ scgid23865/ Regulation of enolase protein 1